MFLCIGKAHEMYKSYERVGLRDKWQAGVTRPVLGGLSSNTGTALGEIEYRGGGLVFVKAGIEQRDNRRQRFNFLRAGGFNFDLTPLGGVEH